MRLVLAVAHDLAGTPSLATGLQSVLRSLLRSGLYSLLAAASSYAATIFLARTSSPELLAGFLLAMAWGIVFVLVIDVAAEQCLVHFQMKNDLTRRQAFANAFAIKCSIALLVAGAALLVNRSGWTTVPSAALYFVVPAFYLTPHFELTGRNSEFAAITLAERVAFLGLAIVTGRADGSLDVLYVGYLTISLLSLTLQARRAGIGLRSMVGSVAMLQRPTVAAYVFAYWPVYAVLMAQIAYGHISRLVLEARVGLLAFGAATLALQLTNVVQIVQSQVDRHFRPGLIAAAKEGRRAVLQAHVINYVAVYVLPAAGLAVLLAIVAKPVVDLLFGERWAIAATYVRAAAPLIVTVPMLRLFDLLVLAVDEQRVSLVVTLAMAFTLIATLLLLPDGTAGETYLVAIVAVQAIHVAIIAAIIFRRLAMLGQQAD